jgi:hypothetical protein
MMRDDCFAKFTAVEIVMEKKTVAHHPLDDIIENIYKAN